MDSIVAKYEKEFGAQKNTFAASKQILKEINGRNDTNVMLDLAGQTLQNAQ